MRRREPSDIPEVLLLQHGLSFDEVETRLGLAYMAAGLKHRACAFYLQDIDDRNLYTLAGYPSTSTYASHRFGMSRREASDLLKAGKALMNLPAIDDAFAEGALCWSKVRELVKVATAEHEQKWLDVARELTIDELCLEVRLSEHGGPPRRRDARKGLPEIRLRLNTELPPDIFAEWELLKKTLQAESDQPLAEWECLAAAIELARAALERNDRSANDNVVVVHASEPDLVDGSSVETEDGPVPLDAATADVLACSGRHVDPSSPEGRGGREVSTPLRRRVYARDRHRCRCCGARRRLQPHHVVPWSEGGPTVRENLITLCRYCHSLVHAELICIDGDSETGWRLVDREGREVNGAEVRYRELATAATGQGAHRLVLHQGVGTNDGIVAGTVAGTCGGTMCHEPAVPSVRFDDLVGQPRVIEALRVAVRASVIRGRPVAHTMLTGSPGLGKTTIATAIAGERGVRLHQTTAIHIAGPSDLVQRLRSVQHNEAVFIDEIHGLPRSAAEALYQVMDRRSFTVIGATTDPGQVPAPLLGRFENHELLAFYETGELADLIRRSADRAGVPVTTEAAVKLAAVSRGTPRRALRLRRRLEDEALAAGHSVIDSDLVTRTIKRLGIDDDGLDGTDREYLRILRERGPDRPLGLRCLALLLGVDNATLERDHEPYLFRLGLATTTPQGRIALAGCNVPVEVRRAAC